MACAALVLFSTTFAQAYYDNVRLEIKLPRAFEKYGKVTRLHLEPRMQKSFSELTATIETKINEIDARLKQIENSPGTNITEEIVRLTNLATLLESDIDALSALERQVKAGSRSVIISPERVADLKNTWTYNIEDVRTQLGIYDLAKLNIFRQRGLLLEEFHPSDLMVTMEVETSLGIELVTQVLKTPKVDSLLGALPVGDGPSLETTAEGNLGSIAIRSERTHFRVRSCNALVATPFI